MFLRFVQIILFFILLTNSATAQQVEGMHQRFNSVSENELSNLYDLVQHLTEGISTEADKAAILHRWLIGYLHYDTTFSNGNPRKRNQSIRKVLDSKTAVCQGYANLFAALCRTASIRCEIVYGYCRLKPEGQLSLEEPNHAWNALQIDGQWYLTDPTWDSDYLHHQGLNQGPFYQAKPEEFVKMHLPADPMWQLLEQPVPLNTFAKSEQSILTYLQSTLPDKTPYAFRDSLKQYYQIPPPLRKLLTATRAYRLNPSKANSQELTAVYLDYEGYLSDHPPVSDHADSLIAYQQQLIDLCELAAHYSSLFANNEENCAYNYINYAVALSRSLDLAKDRKEELVIIDKMKTSLQQAKAILQGLPKNMFIEQGLSRCEQYLDFCENY